jgi:hypothetical protein
MSGPIGNRNVENLDNWNDSLFLRSPHLKTSRRARDGPKPNRGVPKNGFSVVPKWVIWSQQRDQHFALSR